MEKIDIQNRRTARSRTFRVVISKMEDGSYMANVPVLEHCFSFGETIDEVIVNIQEALEGVLETMEANGWPIPDDSQNMEVLITIPAISQSLAYA
jgi:antitoxin HicB